MASRRWVSRETAMPPMFGKESGWSLPMWNGASFRGAFSCDSRPVVGGMPKIGIRE